MYRSIGIDRLELDLFDSAWSISESPFFEDLFGASTDPGMSGVDVVVEHRVCFVVTIGNSNRKFSVSKSELPRKQSLDTTSSDLFDVLQQQCLMDVLFCQ